MMNTSFVTEETNGNLNCNDAPVPAALQPLTNARETLHADLMSLVRNFSDPENESCGIAWLVGGGEKAIESADKNASISVVSDSNGIVSPPAFPDNATIPYRAGKL